MKLFKCIAVVFTMVLSAACGEDEFFNFSENEGQVEGTNVELSGAVDLGLSVKWAACDLGANLPYVSGTEFPGTKIFQFGMSNICGTEYDPATQSLGEGWRMPTKQEIEELIVDCKWKKAVFHSTQGWLVTGPSGRSIFIKPIDVWSGSAESMANTIYAYVLHLEEPHNYSSQPFIERENYGGTFAIRPVKE